LVLLEPLNSCPECASKVAGRLAVDPVFIDLSVIARFYRDTTPGGAQISHWNINKLPPSEFYERIGSGVQFPFW
jgi:hypothetical protein